MNEDVQMGDCEEDGDLDHAKDCPWYAGKPCVCGGLKYTLCKHCHHFVDEEPEGWEHLEDGEQEFDHDAEPSEESMTLCEWHAKRPELFVKLSDDKIGPNSSHFDRKGKIDGENADGR